MGTPIERIDSLHVRLDLDVLVAIAARDGLLVGSLQRSRGPLPGQLVGVVAGDDGVDDGVLGLVDGPLGEIDGV